MNEIKKEAIDSLFGMYRAKVIDDKDPEFFGKVKIWIPSLFADIPDNTGIWALPANNPVGGRNDLMNIKSGDSYYGSCYIPIKDSWIWIFFEGGNINRPYYLSSLDIQNKPVPPENQKGTNYQHKWTILRTPNGRVIILSDDIDDERLELTGKKNNITDVYTIDGNQKTILIDERENHNKILIKDELGNYINIDTQNQKIHMYSEDNINIKTDNNINTTIKENSIQINGGDYVLTINGNLNVKVNGSINYISEGDINIKSNSSINISATSNINIYSESGVLTTGMKGCDIFSEGAINLQGSETRIQIGANTAAISNPINDSRIPESPIGNRDNIEQN